MGKVRPKRAAKTGQDGPKEDMSPRVLQEGPKRHPRDSRRPEIAPPKRPQEGPKRPQKVQDSPPKESKGVPREPQASPKRHPREPQESSRVSRESLKGSSRDPPSTSKAPSGHLNSFLSCYQNLVPGWASTSAELETYLCLGESLSISKCCAGACDMDGLRVVQSISVELRRTLSARNARTCV